MGTASSKFCKYIKHGDEAAAVQLLKSSSELRRALDPNATYKGIHNCDTPLHCVCRHGLTSLVRIFVSEFGGNPNRQNVKGETSLHCLCCMDSNLSEHQQVSRLECLELLLAWKGAVSSNIERAETVDLGATDCKGNTALHYAAAAGIKKFVEVLVSHGAPLFTENVDKETPCDVAEKEGHSEVALYLESKMVFSGDDQNAEDLDALLVQMEADEGYCGLRAQDVQEAKDHLIVETADMLQVPLFTAEALLRNHEWSRESMLESWIVDPVACCHKCGVNPPKCVNQRACGIQICAATEDRLPAESHTSSISTVCEICADTVPSIEEPVPMPCSHHFCRECWEKYLSGKIQDGEAHHITCPGFQCDRLVPVDLIETLVPREMARRYLQFDIKAFVDSNPAIKWCPFPGCGRAVKLPDNRHLSPSSQPVNSWRTANRNNQPSDWSLSVDCGNKHTFCWECLGDAHAPASCDNWKNWHQKIAEIKPEELNGTEEEMENSANCLWLVTNSKPCSSCKSPIQKNEGCNHIKCSKCKHDFCWVCLESWKKHSTATGGYFRCNRYEVVKKVEEQQESLKTEAELKNRRVIELNRFVHYYSRFKNHENSYKLELPLYETAKDKMQILARAMINDEDQIQQEIKFIQEAVTQLLKARHVLKCSYVYGYYLEQIGYKKSVFEFMQTELEECTEVLSQMISRPYLRTPRSKIVQAAQNVQLKRHEFLGAIAKGLVPSDTSPSLKKKHKIFSVEVDEGTRKVLLASLNKNPQTSWVKGPSGKHTNVSALLDWPDNSDESDSETVTSSYNGITLTMSNSCGFSSVGDVSTEVEQAGISSPASDGTCKRSGCRRLRVLNPRTGQQQDYCSIKCKNLDHQQSGEPELTSYMPDYNMELLRALEMSRIQFLAETERSYLDVHDTGMTLHALHAEATYQSDARASASARSVHISSGVDIDSRIQQAIEKSKLLTRQEEQDLRFAIELSMQDTAALDMSDNRPPVVGCATNSDTWAAAAADHSVCNANTESNVFGVIKDVKISNIVASDDDKTVQFETKNFKHMIGQSLVSTPLVESSVAAVSFSQDDQYNPSSMAGCSSGC